MDLDVEVELYIIYPCPNFLEILKKLTLGERLKENDAVRLLWVFIPLVMWALP